MEPTSLQGSVKWKSWTRVRGGGQRRCQRGAMLTLWVLLSCEPQWDSTSGSQQRQRNRFSQRAPEWKAVQPHLTRSPARSWWDLSLQHCKTIICVLSGNLLKQPKEMMKSLRKGPECQALESKPDPGTCRLCELG